MKDFIDTTGDTLTLKFKEAVEAGIPFEQIAKAGFNVTRDAYNEVKASVDKEKSGKILTLTTPEIDKQSKNLWKP